MDHHDEGIYNLWLTVVSLFLIKVGKAGIIFQLQKKIGTQESFPELSLSLRVGPIFDEVEGVQRFRILVLTSNNKLINLQREKYANDHVKKNA